MGSTEEWKLERIEITQPEQQRKWIFKKINRILRTCDTITKKSNIHTIRALKGRRKRIGLKKHLKK